MSAAGNVNLGKTLKGGQITAGKYPELNSVKDLYPERAEACWDSAHDTTDPLGRNIDAAENQCPGERPSIKHDREVSEINTYKYDSFVTGVRQKYGNFPNHYGNPDGDAQQRAPQIMGHGHPTFRQAPFNGMTVDYTSSFATSDSSEHGAAYGGFGSQ